MRPVSIAAESEPDGTAAFQSGLRELARLGYYRIERRRLMDGRLETGTAVSEEPVATAVTPRSGRSRFARVSAEALGNWQEQQDPARRR